MFSIAKEIFQHSLLSKRSSALVRVISWLCILGVGIGVAALIIVLSVMNGFDDAIRRRLISVQPHLIVHATESQVSRVSSLVKKAADSPALVSPFVSQDVIVRTAEGYFSGAQARGLNKESIENIIIESRKLRNAEIRSKQGGNFQLPETADLDFQNNDILLGIDLAKSIEAFEGDEIVAISPETLLLPAGTTPIYERLRVRGIIRTNVPEFDGSTVLYQLGSSMKRLQKDSGRESGVEVQLKNPYSFQNLKKTLEAANFKVESWEDRNKALFYSLKMEKIAMGLFLALSVLIASFSILTVLVLLVTHKRSEIGVLMAMGLSRRRARWILTSVGMVLSSLGVLGGLGLGLFVCWVIDTFPIFSLPEIYYDTRIPILIDPNVIGFLLIASSFIAFFSSWLPARFITRGTPAVLLRPIVETSLTNQD
jgi:lipoprotein-releasing system permease protein